MPPERGLDRKVLIAAVSSLVPIRESNLRDDLVGGPGAQPRDRPSTQRDLLLRMLGQLKSSAHWGAAVFREVLTSTSLTQERYQLHVRF